MLVNKLGTQRLAFEWYLGSLEITITITNDDYSAAADVADDVNDNEEDDNI